MWYGFGNCKSPFVNISCHLQWEKLPDFSAFPLNLHWQEDTKFFPACWILIGQFKFPACQPYGRMLRSFSLPRHTLVPCTDRQPFNEYRDHLLQSLLKCYRYCVYLADFVRPNPRMRKLIWDHTNSLTQFILILVWCLPVKSNFHSWLLKLLLLFLNPWISYSLIKLRQQPW